MIIHLFYVSYSDFVRVVNLAAQNLERTATFFVVPPISIFQVRFLPFDFEMATFAGTTEKCKACEKTVYLVDQLAADNKIYHKFCFRCHHCKGTLKLSNYCSFEGVLYCKPHYDQLFKMTGSLEKSFEGIPRTARVVRSADQVQTNSKVSCLFAGTQEKCVACEKTVYPIEKVAVDGKSYHKPCFRCSHGGCVISPSNYVAHEHRLYCRHHHTQLFKQKGNFSKLDQQDNTTTQ